MGKLENNLEKHDNSKNKIVSTTTQKLMFSIPRDALKFRNDAEPHENI